MRMFTHFVLQLVAAAAWALASASFAADKPNIVFILVDNVGWGDFGVYGGVTPATHR